MQINVKGHQVDVTPALHDYATSKFDRVTRHFDHLHELNVVLGVEKLLHKAEATIQCSGTEYSTRSAPSDGAPQIFSFGSGVRQ